MPIKHDRKGNEKSNSKVTNTPIKPKKMVTLVGKSDSIIAKANKRGKPRKKISHVLQLTDNLYITCDKHCYKICEVNDGVDKEGNPLRDTSFLYASNLQDIIQIAIKHMIKVPSDVLELSKKLDDVYELIKERVPRDTKPKDLFKEMIKEESSE